jgi:hypothetical protein
MKHIDGIKIKYLIEAPQPPPLGLNGILNPSGCRLDKLDIAEIHVLP